jgi:hypothetical protein
MNENPSPQNTSKETLPSSKSERDLRMRFYGKIREKGEFSTSFISPPAHWIHSNIFSVDPKFDENDAPKKVKSIVTILSVWNTMVGSSIVSVPNCVYNAGIIPTICKKIKYNFSFKSDLWGNLLLYLSSGC